ncbi:MAG: esterase family protein [Clostridia bacterium]|nr:esterase family protein [Clostridia bacterium]
MAFFEMHIYSESLGVQTTVNVIVPQQSNSGEIGVATAVEKKQYPCLYLLHGLSDDHSIWLRRTSIERYAQKYGICVVMPFGGRSFYTDMKYGEKYYTYIAEELPRLMQEFFPVSGKREDNYIAGLSMGGYGALKIALRNCEKFCAAAGISSVADIEKGKERFRNALIPAFGEELVIPKEENLFTLAEEKNSHPQKPRIFMGVGTDDFLYEDNCRLRDAFQKLDYDYTYRESDGIHSWEFWDEYIQYVLEWMFVKEA